ncbi:MAG: TylF/MycF/NovP-related O-methyltransferase, partial [Pirellulaceae bacterium]
LFSFARFLETFCPGDRTRKVLGFDHFRGLADRTDKDGQDERVGNTAEGWNPGCFRDTLFALVEAFNRDAFVQVRPRIELVDGDVCKTAAQYVEDNPGLRLSLLHLDMDLYEPTLAGLNYFVPRINPGGFIFIHDYTNPEYKGARVAVQEFCKANGLRHVPIADGFGSTIIAV